MGAYNHKIQRIEDGVYRLHWMVDSYLRGSRLRFPKCRSRDTDEQGAREFQRKWGVAMPGEVE